jgi:sulfite exporter TauE/SafE
VFWLGTMPALILAGASAERLDRWRANSVYRRVAGVIVMTIGLLALMPVARTLIASA